jgi:PEP-CTERM motif
MSSEAIKGSPWRDLYVHMLKKSTIRLPLFVLGGLAAFILTAPLMADVTYTYTGNDFTIATFPYTTSDSVSGFFTLPTALGDSLTDQTITPTTYSFTDGVQTFTNSDPPSTVTFEVNTGLTGSITEWYVFLQNGSTQTNTISTGSGIPLVNRDFGNVPEGLGEGQGAILFNPGTWKQTGGTSTVPEPGYLGALGLGLAAILFVQRKLQRGRA